MGEKIYKTMKSVGAFNIVMGILLIVTGICTGILVITNGARLLKDKSEIIF
ncbi:MAG: hypothetical protein K1W15_05635 [Lachnospiraceae bacterium]|mgnify:CR=1 FL=1|nr:hypothetical protein [Lachnospiraceae bacterium]MCI9077311.1 hypothetical protein [Lachnospiraceae bacterium]MDE7051773.1 hypothetical protein [Lachnospiraceae bacterium]